MKGKERLRSEIRSVEDGRILDSDGLDWSLRLMRPSLDELLTTHEAITSTYCYRLLQAPKLSKVRLDRFEKASTQRTPS